MSDFEEKVTTIVLPDLYAQGDTVRAADVCDFVRPNSDNGFISVSPREVEMYEPGVEMWEYVDGAGNVWGNLTSVAPHVQTPAWRINADAGNGQYYEQQTAVAGSGVIDIWYGSASGHEGGETRPLPRIGNEAVTVIPGDTFRLRAGNVGLHVLALFPEVPFQGLFEEQVPVPDIMTRPKP